MVSRKDLGISYNAACESVGRPLMTAKSFCAAVRRLRPALTEAQRRVNGEVRDVFLGIELKGQHAQEVSALSAHSALSSQISLQGKQEREDTHNEFKKLPLQNLTQRVDSYLYANLLLQTHRL